MSTFLRSSLFLALACAACNGGAHAQATTQAESEPTSPDRAGVSDDGKTADGGVKLPDGASAYIEVQAIDTSQTAVTLRTPAKVAFRDNAVSRVGAPIPARVMKLHVRVGDKVRPGDPLATLASPDASSYHAELARAKVELSAAQDVLRRQDEMIAKGVGREYERAMAQTRVADAEERVRAAKRAVGLLGRSFGGTVIVTSQLDGTVLRRNASIGAQVDPDGDPLFEIGNPKDLWVVADVFQDDLPLVAEGATVTVEFASRREPLEGTVASIGVLLDTAVRRAPVYIDLKASELGDLKAGMFARAFIQAEMNEGVTVPLGTVLIKNGDNPIVYVETAPGTFVSRPVEIGHTYEDRVQVVSGLAPGDRVAVRGALLIDGAANQLL